jgi:rod shape-determining protein MreD
LKFLSTAVMALVLLSLESVIVKYLGFSITRIDVTVTLVAFLALRASTQEGAISAFVIGYLLDLSTGRPTGLYTFLAVLIFLLGKLAASLVDVRSGPMFALFAMGSDFGHGLFAAFFTWLTTRKDAGSGFSLSTLPGEVLLTGLAALALYPLLRRIDPGNERPQVGALR